MKTLNKIIEELVEENEELKQRISKLKNENKRLKKSHYNGWVEKDKVIKNLMKKITN